MFNGQPNGGGISPGRSIGLSDGVKDIVDGQGLADRRASPRWIGDWHE